MSKIKKEKLNDFEQMIQDDPERSILVMQYLIDFGDVTPEYSKTLAEVIKVIKIKHFNKDSVWTLGHHRGTLIQDKEIL